MLIQVSLCCGVALLPLWGVVLAPRPPLVQQRGGVEIVQKCIMVWRLYRCPVVSGAAVGAVTALYPHEVMHHHLLVLTGELQRHSASVLWVAAALTFTRGAVFGAPHLNTFTLIVLKLDRGVHPPSGFAVFPSLQFTQVFVMPGGGTMQLERRGWTTTRLSESANQGGGYMRTWRNREIEGQDRRLMKSTNAARNTQHLRSA